MDIGRREKTKMIPLGLVMVLAASLAGSGPSLPSYTADFPDASRIVFSSDMGGNEDLYLLSRNALTRLTDDPATDEWPVPDGKGEDASSSPRTGPEASISILSTWPPGPCVA